MGRPLRMIAVAAMVILLLAVGASAQTTTVIGTIKDLSGNVVPGGQITFELRPGGDTTISGNGRFVPSTLTCSINQSMSFNSSTGLSRSSNVVTVTFTSPHSFIVGDVVTVTGMSNTGFNGTFTVASVADTSHVTWSQTAGNATTGGGIISALRASPGPGSCLVTQNTALQPAGTGYNVCLWPLGARTSCFGWYAIGVGPVDLSTTVPTPGTMPLYAFVDTINNQTIAGNKTFTGNTVFQGTVTFPNTFALTGTFSTTTANPATVGIFRTANNENSLCMRNAANSANLCLILDNTNTLKFNGSALGTGGTVTSFSAGALSPLFTTSVATGTTTPALSFAAVSQSANVLYSSPCGSSGNPSFHTICLGEAIGTDATDQVSTAGTSFTATGLTTGSVTTYGGRIHVTATGSGAADAGARAFFTINLDAGADTQGTLAEVVGTGSAGCVSYSMTYIFSAAAGAHTLSVRVASDGGAGGTAYAFYTTGCFTQGVIAATEIGP